MGNMFDMMKQAGAMRKQMKKMQKELARKTAEGASNGVTVVARGDMSVQSVSVDPGLLDASNQARLEKAVVSAVNSALSSAKKMAGEEMSKMTGGLGGLSDMLGG